MLPDINCFPNNVVDVITTAMIEIDPSLRVVNRPVQDTDYGLTVGIIPGTWSPDPETKEMAGGFAEPTIQRYSVNIQGLVIDMDATRGARQSSVLNTLIRRKLYRNTASLMYDPDLRIELGGYKETLSGHWDIGDQRFGNDEIGRNYTFLSSVDFSFDTIVDRI